MERTLSTEWMTQDRTACSDGEVRRELRWLRAHRDRDSEPPSAPGQAGIEQELWNCMIALMGKR